MRNLALIISFMAMPLVACGQHDEMPAETDPAQQSTGVPSPPVDSDPPSSDDTAHDRSAMKPGMNEPQPEPAMPIDQESATE